MEETRLGKVKSLLNEGCLSREEIADLLGMKRETLLFYFFLAEHGYSSAREYQEKCAMKNGFDSFSHYVTKGRNEKAQSDEYKEFANFLRGKLRETGLSVRALADKAGIKERSIYSYLGGKSIPRKPEHAQRIFFSLGLGYQSLDEFLARDNK